MKTVKLCAKTTRYFNNRYYKNYYATIPHNFIENLSLQAGDDLSVEQKDQSIVLMKVHKIDMAATQVSKDTFKRIIIQELANGPKTWSELRGRTHLPFKRPPPRWVRELQMEYGVEITYDAVAHCMRWKIKESLSLARELVFVSDFGKTAGPKD